MNSPNIHENMLNVKAFSKFISNSFFDCLYYMVSVNLKKCYFLNPEYPCEWSINFGPGLPIK